MTDANCFRSVLGVAILLAACTNEPAAPAPPLEPTFGAGVATSNSYNVLAAVVSVRVSHADSVAVQFHPADAASAGDSLTPAVQALGDSAAVPIFGLLPATRYILHAVAYGPGGNVCSDPIELTTDPLPPDLPQYSADGSDPSPGYVVFATKIYGLVIDNTGRVVWYHRFPNGPGLNFMAEPNGRYVARPSTPDPSDIESWLELDPLGNITRTLECGLGLQPRPHDLISALDGSYWLMCDDVRTMDLTAAGGRAGARVTGTAVQHMSAAGTLLFSWSPFDHFAITDLDPIDLSTSNINWTHGNGLDLDVDGNLIVSFRNLSEVTKIDVVSGAVIWRMGGRRNQFTFVDLPFPFSGQHGVRVTGPGALMILDNLGTAGESRSERYTLDAVTRTARLVQAHASTPGVVTQIGGSVQSLPGGRTLVSFGTAGRVEEYDSTGRITWSISGDPGYVFRAQRIRSLYAPGVGTAR